MNIYLIAYLSNNLGDDLFIDLIVNRYKNFNFSIISYSKCDFKYKNLKIIKMNFFRRVFNKLLKIISNGKYDINSFYSNKNDITITIGGSLFMESSKSYNALFYNSFKKPYFIIGSNVGPYYSEKYLGFLEKNIFRRAKDICFRDKKSFNLFEKNKNVRYAPDLLFSFDLSNYKIIIPKKKKAIISVIDISRKKDQIKNANQNLYENLILKIITFFEKKNYVVELISFCDEEGDNSAIDRIINKTNNCVERYSYNGNISDIITELSTATTIVGTRFHANILGFIMKKNVIPIIYNDKTKNMLIDIDFKGCYFDLNDHQKMDINNLSVSDLNYVIDVKKQVKESNNHFYEIDNFIYKGD